MMISKNVILPLISIFYVESKENSCHNDAQYRATRQNRINCEIDLAVFNNSNGLIFRRRSTNLKKKNDDVKRITK